MLKLYSWNVNGVRAVAKKGFPEWLARERPDVLCIQETKAHPDQLQEELKAPKGYATVWASAERKGYSGVATFYRKGLEPLEVATLGNSNFDDEGRVQVIAYTDFTLVNAYFPNSQPERRRLDYKLAFCDSIRKFCNKLRRTGKNVVLCGDFNIAHKPIDLARPKENENNPGYFPEERAAMDAFIRAGYVDTFRYFNKDPGHYTWWSYRANARANNVGWRLDYHCVNKEFIERVKEARILSSVMGSDHCPVAITID